MAVNKILKAEQDRQQQQWKGDLALVAMNDGNSNVRAAAIYGLGLWMERSQQPLMLESLADSSYMVAGNALYALNRISPDTAYQLARKRINEKAGTNLARNAWSIIAAKGKPADTALFYPHARSGQQDYLMTYIALYAINTADYPAFRSAVQLLSEMVAKVEHKTQRAHYAATLGSVYAALNNRLKKDKKDTLSREKMDFLQIQVAALKNNETEKEVLKVYDKLGE